MISILGIDPGGDTGIAWLACEDDFSAPTIMVVATFPRLESLSYVRTALRDLRISVGWRRVIVACEAYTNYADASQAKTGSNNPESTQIGQFSEMAAGCEFEFVQFPTAIKKPAWVWGSKYVECRTKTKHERDACCHALWAYRHLTLGKSMAPKVKRQKVVTGP